MSYVSPLRIILTRILVEVAIFKAERPSSDCFYAKTKLHSFANKHENKEPYKEFLELDLISWNSFIKRRRSQMQQFSSSS
jgi:hypothetical protein